MTAISDLAKRAGIAVDWTDATGAPKTVPEDVQRAILERLGLNAASPAAARESHRMLDQTASEAPLTVVRPRARLRTNHKRVRFCGEDGPTHETRAHDGVVMAPALPGYYTFDGSQQQLAVVPKAAQGVGRNRIWAVAAQLYALRGSHTTGFGDFGALAEFVADVGRQGASAVAISPVHALFGAARDHISPYAPSSRLFLNPLYAGVSGSRTGDGGDIIDWPTAAVAKREALRRSFARQRDDRSFSKFVREGGARLLDHARFEVLDARFRKNNIDTWRQWPAEYRHSGSAAVQSLRADDRQVQFQLFLQWRAQADLQNAQASALRAGMSVGLITDMAVGMDPAGSHAWSVPNEILQGLSIGAPPDIYNQAGQNWGLTGFSPQGLVRGGFAGFLSTLRAAMRHAGGIRLDHAMGLQRLWVIPEGGAPSDGAYLHYPFAEMLGLLALESRRHRAIVIAEDLGTVPDGFRARIARAGLLGMRVLWFERDAKGNFLSPSQWDRNAAALSTTHDLPTLAGWWRGHDIGWRKRLGATPAALNKARKERDQERRKLWRTLKQSGCASGAMPPPAKPKPFTDAAIKALAQTPCPIVVLPVEDFIGESKQPNIPGTINEHPNWRRRLKQKAPLGGKDAQRRLAILRDARP